MNREYLQGLSKISDDEKAIIRYKAMIESSALRGGKGFKITNIPQAQVSQLMEKMISAFPLVSINIEEIHNPIMVKPEKIIVLDWS